MSENITAVKLKKTFFFFLVPGAGTFELKSFHIYGRAFDQLSCPRGREFDKQRFQKFKCPVNIGEDVEVSNLSIHWGH